MDIVTSIFSIVVLIFSVMIHELAHGVTADSLGDPTARLAGRLTFNPLAHADWLGSFVVPLLCIISGTGFIIGWAKPVPFNPAQLSHKRWGPALVAAAGPLSNIVIALVLAVAFRVITHYNTAGWIAFAQMLSIIVIINISLAIFNLIPIPPLDGHHLLGAVFPTYRLWSERLLTSYGFVIILLVILLAGSIISPIILFVAHLLLGI
jgi:Zn-dependent protease